MNNSNFDPLTDWRLYVLAVVLFAIIGFGTRATVREEQVRRAAVPCR